MLRRLNKYLSFKSSRLNRGSFPSSSQCWTNVYPWKLKVEPNARNRAERLNKYLNIASAIPHFRPNRRRIFPDNNGSSHYFHFRKNRGTIRLIFRAADRVKWFRRISPMEYEDLTFVARYPISEPAWKFHVKLGHRYFISETRASFRLWGTKIRWHWNEIAQPVTLSADVQNKEHYLPNLWTPADAWWIS